MLLHGLLKVGFKGLLPLIVACEKDAKTFVLELVAPRKLFGESRLRLSEVKFQGFQTLRIGVLKIRVEGLG